MKSPFLLSEIPDALAQMHEGIDRVVSIVQAMKDYCHPGTLEKTQCEINDLVQSTLTISHNKWKAVAAVKQKLDPALPRVPCFPAELSQVILNIIVNAADAIADVVDGKCDTKGLITVTTCQKGNEVEIRISDTGTGIPEEIQSRIFDLFFTSKKIGKGTGQGLAIARSIVVDKHCGTIDFETEEGKGTTFFVCLPLDTLY